MDRIKIGISLYPNFCCARYFSHRSTSESYPLLSEAWAAEGELSTTRAVEPAWARYAQINTARAASMSKISFQDR